MGLVARKFCYLEASSKGSSLEKFPMLYIYIYIYITEQIKILSFACLCAITKDVSEGDKFAFSTCVLKHVLL